MHGIAAHWLFTFVQRASMDASVEVRHVSIGGPLNLG